jgi:hypothetical protein
VTLLLTVWQGLHIDLQWLVVVESGLHVVEWAVIAVPERSESCNVSSACIEAKFSMFGPCTSPGKRAKRAQIVPSDERMPKKERGFLDKQNIFT